MTTSELTLYYTGIVFWVACAFVGLFFIADWITWFVADKIIKRLKLQTDLYAFIKDRYQKKNGIYPG